MVKKDEPKTEVPPKEDDDYKEEEFLDDEDFNNRVEADDTAAKDAGSLGLKRQNVKKQEALEEGDISAINEDLH